MIKNIGGKLQGLGEFILWGGILASVIAFIVVQVNLGSMRDMAAFYEEEMAMASTTATLILFLGPLTSVFLGLVTNGFGTLINNTMPKLSMDDSLSKPEAE